MSYTLAYLVRVSSEAELWGGEEENKFLYVLVKIYMCYIYDSFFSDFSVNKWILFYLVLSKTIYPTNSGATSPFLGLYILAVF